MTLFELLVFVFCIGVAFSFSIHMTSSHGWFLGVLVFPLGFCATAEVLCLLGEAAIRSGRRKGGRTPGSLIGYSLLVGAISGVVLGIAFYGLGIFGIIPTLVQSAHTLVLSALLFGMSVGLSFAFVWMVRRSNEIPVTKSGQAP